jgi:hypothetical protein
VRPQTVCFRESSWALPLLVFVNDWVLHLHPQKLNDQIDLLMLAHILDSGEAGQSRNVFRILEVDKHVPLPRVLNNISYARVNNMSESEQLCWSSALLNDMGQDLPNVVKFILICICIGMHCMCICMCICMC